MAKSRGVVLLANDFLSFEMLTFQCCNCFTVFFCWRYLCVLQQKPDLLNLLVVSPEAAGFCYLFMCVFVRVCVCEVFVGILSLECFTGKPVSCKVDLLPRSESFVDS